NNDGSPPETRLRLWPAIVIAMAYAVAACGFRYLGSTNVQSFIELVIVPLAAVLLLIVWWLAASRVPLRDRLAGLVFVAVALLLVVFTQKRNGAMLLAYAIPAMTVGSAIVLAVSFRLSWKAQRWMTAGFIVICTGVFMAMRVDTIGGNLAPIMSWRWTETEEERSIAIPHANAHGTAAVPAEAGPGDWPAFRGPYRESRVTGVTFSTNWSTPPREVWRREVGPAWSSFIAVGDYLFTQEQAGQQELVTCYRAGTGEPVWINRIDARFEDTMGLGPRATPAFDRGRLYVQGGTGVLQCLDASTGAVVWRRELTKDAETGVPGYGFASSPLVVGDRVFVFSSGGEGKSVVAYDRTTGEVNWRAGHGTDSYASPHMAFVCGVSQIIMAGDFGMQAFVPETGATLWEYAWKVKTNPRCVQPLLVDNERVMLGATGTTGSRLLRIQQQEGKWNVREEWSSKQFRPYFNDGVKHKGDCYGFDGERFVCVDMKTGKRRWEGKRYSGQMLLLADMDVALILSEAGDVVLVQAIPDRFNEVARFKALAAKTWNHPVIAHGRLFVRNAEEAACFDLGPAMLSGGSV
ncbi:MAG TPA: PQQ-like beta-propeller repeat protein, partial [Candidatus Hydrogenedentes bacterium]|nr:PQQ-like beta-propeller repeat protein [Candidatus Hydrogenedentota bacterium]